MAKLLTIRGEEMRDICRLEELKEVKLRVDRLRERKIFGRDG